MPKTAAFWFPAGLLIASVVLDIFDEGFTYRITTIMGSAGLGALAGAAWQRSRSAGRDLPQQTPGA